MRRHLFLILFLLFFAEAYSQKGIFKGKVSAKYSAPEMYPMIQIKLKGTKSDSLFYHPDTGGYFEIAYEKLAPNKAAEANFCLRDAIFVKDSLCPWNKKQIRGYFDAMPLVLDSGNQKEYSVELKPAIACQFGNLFEYDQINGFDTALQFKGFLPCVKSAWKPEWRFKSVTLTVSYWPTNYQSPELERLGKKLKHYFEQNLKGVEVKILYMKTEDAKPWVNVSFVVGE